MLDQQNHRAKELEATALSFPTVQHTDILLVEDNPLDAALMMAALKKCDCAETTCIAHDGAEALDFLFATGSFTARRNMPPPKVIFLDLKLPKVSGLEVLETIKTDPVFKSIPVVILTSSKELKDIQRSYALGANSYIVKPIEAGKFTEAVIINCRYWLEYVHAPA